MVDINLAQRTEGGRGKAGPFVIPALGVLVAIAAPRLVWHRLPDPVATHWSTAGTPDGSMSRLADWLLLAGIIAVAGLMPLLLVGTARIGRGGRRAGAAIATGMTVFLVGLRLLTLWCNVDAADWTEARELPLLGLVATIGAGLIAAAVAGWLTRAPAESDTTAPTHSGRRVRAGVAARWSGTATSALSVLLPLLGVIGAIVAVLFLPETPGVILAITLAAIALAGALFGRAVVQVGPDGVLVRLGWFGWPRLSVPLAEIADVTVEQVEPLRYGGWGVRLVPGATAVVIRRGEGLRVQRSTGRALVVTVDGADAAAAALLGYAEATKR